MFLIFLQAIITVNAQVRTIGVAENRMLIESGSFRFHTDHANMILNIANGDFFMSFDAAAIKTGDKSIDSALAANGQQIVVFKSNISESIFRFNQQIDDEKEYNMPGVFISDGYETQCIARFNPKSLADKSDVKNYRMDFTLSVNAENVHIKGLESKLIKDVLFQIMGGRLNVQP
ncbi:MAG: hypothetical protein ACXVNM_06010 [Bacteroidia bacterium]